MKILVVDDSHLIRDMYVKVLDCALPDAEVVTAETVPEGLSALGASKFDIAILDYEVPPTDTMAIYRLAVEKNVPAIICSGRSRCEIESDYPGQLFNHLQKPLSMDRLLSWIYGYGDVLISAPIQL